MPFRLELLQEITNRFSSSSNKSARKPPHRFRSVFFQNALLTKRLKVPKLTIALFAKYAEEINLGKLNMTLRRGKSGVENMSLRELQLLGKGIIVNKGRFCVGGILKIHGEKKSIKFAIALRSQYPLNDAQ